MAHVVVDGEKVRLHLSVLEILGAFHRSPEVDLSEVESIEIEEIKVSNIRETLKELDQSLIEKFLTTSQIYLDSSNQKVVRWVDVLLNRLRFWKRANS